MILSLLGQRDKLVDCTQPVKLTLLRQSISVAGRDQILAKTIIDQCYRREERTGPRPSTIARVSAVRCAQATDARAMAMLL